MASAGLCCPGMLLKRPKLVLAPAGLRPIMKVMVWGCMRNGSQQQNLSDMRVKEVIGPQKGLVADNAVEDVTQHRGSIRLAIPPLPLENILSDQ